MAAQKKYKEEIPINFSKSIDKKRLIYSSLGDNADYYLTYFFDLIFIIVASTALAVNIKVMPFLAVIILLTTIIWMAANIFFLNVLVEIKGGSIEHNRKNVITILNDYFNRNIENEGQLIIRDVKYSGFIYFGRIITVLLESDSIYINIQSLGRADAVSVFHGFTDYLKAKRIAKRFSNLQLKEIV